MSERPHVPDQEEQATHAHTGREARARTGVAANTTGKFLRKVLTVFSAPSALDAR